VESTALTSIIHELLYLCLLIGELYEVVPLPIPMLCDKQATITLASNRKFQSHTKHIDLCYHFIRSHVRDRTFRICYCPTDNNLANTFTKALPHPCLQTLRSQMALACAQGGVLEPESSTIMNTKVTEGVQAQGEDE
jgi:hypothetical protein